MKLGQEVFGTPAASVTELSQNRNLADLHADLLKLYGVSPPALGGGDYQSTGKPSGLLV
jgi:hypothetical protein